MLNVFNNFSEQAFNNAQTSTGVGQSDNQTGKIV